MVGAEAINKRRLAVGLMVMQGCLFAAETATVHHIGPRASVMQLTLLRGVAGIVLVFLLARDRGWLVVKTEQLPLQLLRGLVSALYFWVMMYSFSRLPFADATAISYTQAAYIAVFAALILHERVSSLRWTAALMGIAGAMLIVKPTFSDWNFAYIVALLGTSLNGLAFVLNRYLQRSGGDSDLTTMFYVNMVAAVCNLPVLLRGDLPPPETWPWLLGVVLFGPLGTYVGIAALRRAPASVLGPYTLLRLVIGVVGGIAMFHEVPDALGTTGVAVILASCALAVMSTTPRRSR